MRLRITDSTDFETDAQNAPSEYLTTPNGMSALRAVGGVALGYAIWKNYVSPQVALGLAGFLATTDAEGTVINWSKRLPEQKRMALKIWPTKIGEKLDVVADKIFAVSVIGGGIAGSMISPYASAILVPEIATVSATGYAKNATGEDPKVSRTGKVGMMTRFGTIMSYLGSSATQGYEALSETLVNVGHAGVIGSVILGSLSAYKIYSDARQSNTEGLGQSDTLLAMDIQSIMERVNPASYDPLSVKQIS